MSADPLDAARKLLDEEVEQFASPPLGAYEDEPRANEHAAKNAVAADEPPGRRLPGINFADMRPHLSVTHIIKGLLGRNTVAMCYGPSGEGKTFFATNLSLHIAAELSWRDHRVAGGLVVYVALEGAASAENRFCAARDALKLTDRAVPLVLTPGPINLRDPLEVHMLIQFIQERESDHGVKAVAVFVDTLSRAMAGGDENGPEDMGALVQGADAVRLATGATIVLVHHSGKDTTRGGRGHSSLRAALDTEIEITKTGNLHVATVTKQRDLPGGARYAFRLDVVELGRDDDGDAVTTCIVQPADDASGVAATRMLPRGKNQSALCAALQEWLRAHDGNRLISSMEFRQLAKTQGIQPKRLIDIADSLAKCGWLRSSVGGYLVLPDSQTES